MFEGFLQSNKEEGKKPPSGNSQHKAQGSALPNQQFKTNRLSVLTAKKLLHSKQHQRNINRLKALLHFDDGFAIYHSLCQNTIDSFAEFVQRLPATKNGYYSHHGGILEHALERATEATHNCHRHFMPSASDNHKVPAEYCVWLYIVFSAALYHRLGPLIIKFDVECHHDGGSFPWLPVVGSMVGQATHYQYFFTEKNYDHLARDTTKIIASRLIPDAGLAWITSQRDTFAVWLALLDERWDEVGSLSGFIPQAQNETILKYFEEIADRRFQHHFDHEIKPSERARESMAFLQRGLQPNSNADSSASAQAKQDMNLLATFKEWLQKEIANGNINMNEKKSFVNVLRHGVLISFPILFSFIRANPNAGNWQQLINRFAHMGILHMNAHTAEAYHYKPTGAESKTAQPSILIKDAGLVLTSKQAATRTTQSFAISKGAASPASASIPSAEAESTHRLGKGFMPPGGGGGSGKSGV